MEAADEIPGGVAGAPLVESECQDMASLPPGSLAGEYEIARALAAGAFGTVYEAEHRVLHRRAAIKVPHRATSDAVQRFAREARSINLIRHPSIVDVYGYGHLRDGRPYFVMEFLEGVTLEALLGERAKLAPRDAFELLAPICGALTAAHDADIVHRDVKPSNIFIAKTGVKLLDFGVAKLLQPPPWEPDLTTMDQLVGTPAVMAPEQILNGVVGARSDIYSLGVVLFRALTGEYPFKGNSVDLQAAHLITAPPIPSSIAPLSPEIDDLLLRCLAKDAAERYPSMDEFCRAFERAMTAFDEAMTLIGSTSSAVRASTLVGVGAPMASGSQPSIPAARPTRGAKVATAGGYPLVTELLTAMPQATAKIAAVPAKPIAAKTVHVRRSWALTIAALVVLSGLGGAALGLCYGRSEAANEPARAAIELHPVGR